MENTNGVGWVLLNSSIKETVVTLAKKHFEGIELTTEEVTNTAVEVTQRGALSGASAMISAIGVMANTLVRYTKAFAKQYKPEEGESTLRFEPKKHSVIINNDICIGICNESEESNSYVRDLALENPNCREYILLNLNTESFKVSGGAR